MTENEYRTLVRTINGAWPSRPWQPEHAAVWWPIFADHTADLIAQAIHDLQTTKTDPWTPAPGEVIATAKARQQAAAERSPSRPALDEPPADPDKVAALLSQARTQLTRRLSMPPLPAGAVRAEQARQDIARGHNPLRGR